MPPVERLLGSGPLVASFLARGHVDDDDRPWLQHSELGAITRQRGSVAQPSVVILAGQSDRILDSDHPSLTVGADQDQVGERLRRAEDGNGRRQRSGRDLLESRRGAGE